MSASVVSLCLGWLFVHPLSLPAGARFWMMLPLVACVATVYRACRARSPGDLPKATVLSFVTIIAGMAAIAAGFYVVHLLAKLYL
jgi:hypothetical protein